MSASVLPASSVQDRLLSPAQRAFWEENGYVVIPNAVPQENLDAVIDAIWDFLQVDRNDPDTGRALPISRLPVCWRCTTISRSGTIARTPRFIRHLPTSGRLKNFGLACTWANMNPPACQPDWDYQGMHHFRDADTSQTPLPRMVQGVLY